MDNYKGYDVRKILEHSVEVAEVFDDMRKGIAQTFYVVRVPEEVTYWDETKEDMVTDRTPPDFPTLWRMSWSDDLKYTPLSQALKDYDWEPCKAVDVTVTEYQKI